jgi:hypothetical protein
MTTAVLVWLVIVALIAGVAIAYRANRIGIVVGLLFAAASFSRVTAPLGPYAVRLEQPALALLIGLVVLRERAVIVRVVAGNRWLVGAAVLYLAANVISSVLFAPRPVDSLRIAGWLGLSMAGGLAVATLVARMPEVARSLPRWIVGAASIQVGVGLVAVVSEAAFKTTWGVQSTDLLLGKTYGLSWEANVLAINLAMALAFVLVPASSLRLSARGRILVTLWLGLGLGLTYSRGGAVGLLAAAVLVGVVVAWTARADPLPALRRFAMPVLQLGMVAFVATFLTAGGLDVLASQGVGWTSRGPSATARPTPGTHTPGPGGGSLEPGATPSPAIPSEAPTAEPIFVGSGDTVAVRLVNIKIALAELPRSPIVGLGTDSFPQRHVEPSCQCPAAISNLMVGSLYDSGILGFAGLAALFLGVLRVAWRRGEWAYLVSLVAMFIGYQATDAFRFASNWIVMGAVIGLSAQWQTSSRRQTVLDRTLED